MQIPLITCPRCLARIINPNAGRETVAAQTRQILRRHRIPLEDEAERDIWGTTHFLWILAAVLVGAGIVLTKMMGMSALSTMLAVAGVVIAGVIWVLRRKKLKIDVPAP